MQQIITCACTMTFLPNIPEWVRPTRKRTKFFSLFSNTKWNVLFWTCCGVFAINNFFQRMPRYRKILVYFITVYLLQHIFNYLIYFDQVNSEFKKIVITQFYNFFFRNIRWNAFFLFIKLKVLPKNVKKFVYCGRITNLKLFWGYVALLKYSMP